MRTYELLKMLNEISRLRLFLNMSLSEVLSVAKDIDIDLYHKLTYTISELNIELEK